MADSTSHSRAAATLRRVALRALFVLSLAVVTAAGSAVLHETEASAQEPIDQIKTLYQEGLSAYDFFEYQDADTKFSEAIEIAKANNVNEPVVAQVYLAKGILFHAQFKDTAPQVAYDKTRDEFISAVSFDYDIEIPSDYFTEELQTILDEARTIVPPPENGGGGSGGGGNDGGKASGDVELLHNVLAVADACEALDVVARIPPHPDAFRAYVYYRTEDAVSYESIELIPDTNDPEAFAAKLPAEAVRGAKLDYYVEVVNRQQTAVANVGSRSQPLSITVVGECDVEPEADGGDFPLVHIFAGVGTGFGLANGDAERCADTPDCYGDDPSRFEGVQSGIAPAPFHANIELGFNVIPELQLAIYGRIQIIELAVMIGAKARYFILSELPHRLYTGIGFGWGDATYVVDLGPDFNNFRDVVRAKGPVHLGFNFGYGYAFHDNVGIQFDVYVPIHFPEFTFHADLTLGPFFQF